MGVNIQTIKDIRFYLTDELNEIYEEPELTALANIIIKTLTGVTKLHQVYLSDQKITIEQADRCIGICRELKSGKPLQYILGETIFYDYTIKLTSATLIPRQETEELVHLVINENKGFKGKILDFGTGSGCIAIALAGNLSGSDITGFDISDEALDVARENGKLNNVNVTFRKADILNFDFSLVAGADIIVSNPPYVRNSEKKLMNRNVLEFEPHQALFVSDSDPLVFYREILNIAEKILKPKGKIYFEINEALGTSMVNLLETFGYADIMIMKDINEKDRIIKGLKNG
jgi:release factor glutamine methyltransferase